MRARYARKRELLAPLLELAPGSSEATFYLWFRVPAGESSEAFATRLLEHGVVVAPGSYFGPSGEGYARLALVPSLEECERAAAILRERAVNVEETIAALDRGEVRVAEKRDGEWVVNEEAKSAIVEYFKLRQIEPQELGLFEYRDKIPLKHGYEELGVRVVPPATARFGAFLSRDVVLMPSYVNIGAWVGPRTMVDTWATVGSCAQIGADVHLAGGVGIGGVLEPVGARPVVVEDGAFIGSRAVIVEGVVVGEQAVIAPQVVLSATVPIIDVTGPEPVEHRGYVPPRSVVVPGNAAEGVPGRHVPARVRADHRQAQGVDRPAHEPQRCAARVRHRHRLTPPAIRRRSRGTPNPPPTAIVFASVVTPLERKRAESVHALGVAGEPRAPVARAARAGRRRGR